MASLRARLRWNAQDRRELSDQIAQTMQGVYMDTLRDLAESYGYDVPTSGLNLSPDVLAEIKATAREHARIIADSYNRDVDAFLERNKGVDDAQLLADFDAWAQDRVDKQADAIAITEAYGAYTDATLSFFHENGIEPEFEFGGHPELGDDPAECKLCQTLEANNPHPYSRVLEVGIPHVQCRQNWHPLVDPSQLPDELRIGGQTSGVLGADPLNITVDGTEAAVAEVQRLATGAE
jgi:hypothetical protein